MTDFDSQTQEEIEDGIPTRRWWHLALVFMISLIVIVIACLPPIIARTSLRQAILPSVLGDYPAETSVGNASLNWLSRVELADVRLDDMQGNRLLNIQRITTQQRLLDVLIEGDEPTSLDLIHPRLHVRFDESGRSNLSELVSEYNKANPKTNKRHRPVRLRLVDGSVVSAEMPSDADALGKIHADVIYRNGAVRIRRIDGRLAGGNFQIKANDPTLSQGSVHFEHVEVRPELVRRSVRYIAPVLADAATAQGRVSGYAEAIPLSTASSTDIDARGEVTIEAGRIERGPLADAIVDLGRRLYAVLERPSEGKLPESDHWHVNIPRQTVAFSAREGKVHHERLKLQVAGLDIQTSGSVGFDESIALSLETQIPSRWVDETDWLDGLANESLNFQVDGSLLSPEVDEAALVALIERLGTRVVVEELADSVETPLLNLLGF
jgi:hypothetical protein